MLFTVIINNVYSQTIKTLEPTIGITHDLSAEAQEGIYRRDFLMDIKEREGFREIQQRKLDSLNEIYPEGKTSIWDIIDDGANWYDSGGPYAVRSSSALKPSNGKSYEASNAQDLKLDTAWVEGVNGNGEGEYLEYFFKNDSPRVTKAIILNGYVKTPQLWKDNSRVKDLDFYVNGEFYASLQLKDIQSEQIFKFPPLGHREDGKDLILKFVIKSVYPGAKYKDTAITEIYFQGIDVY